MIVQGCEIPMSDLSDSGFFACGQVDFSIPFVRGQVQSRIGMGSGNISYINRDVKHGIIDAGIVVFQRECVFGTIFFSAMT